MERVKIAWKLSVCTEAAVESVNFPPLYDERQVMPKSMNKNEDLPLPYNWERGMDYDGKVYYIDHTRKITTWIDPRDR